MRFKAILYCLFYGVMPWRVYEKRRHYTCSYWQHMAVNAGYAWRWLSFQEDEADRAFERETNAVAPPSVRYTLLVLYAAAALLLSGCRTGRGGVATGGPGATVEPTSTLSPASSYTKPNSTNPAAQLVPTPPAPDAPRWQQRNYLDTPLPKGEGLSTYRKNLKAQPPTVPKKLAKGSTYQSTVGDNNQQQQSTGKKAHGPTGQAALDATMQQSQAAKHAQAQAGDGNSQQRTEPARAAWWRTVLNWWPAVALAGLRWFFWPPILALLRRRG